MGSMAKEKMKKKKGEKITPAILWKQRWLLVMSVPFVIWLIIFKYIPLWGWTMAFQEVKPATFALPIWERTWVGFQNFTDAFKDRLFTQTLINTLGVSFLDIAVGTIAAIAFAVLLNEMFFMKFKKVTQTISYLPHFVSWVIVASLTYQLFNVTDGVMNVIYKAISGGQTFDILSQASTFWGLIVGQDIWRETGYGTIVFLAALSSVDQELYEAARVDGAGRWRLMWHITLPAIRGTIIMMLILRVGGILNTGYEQIFLMRNDLNIARAEVFDTYIYTKGIRSGQYSFSTAAGMFKSIVGMIMVLLSDRVAKAFGESGLY